MEIRHVPSCYYKTQLPSLTYTQLVLFDEVHVKQVCGRNILFPRNEEGGVDLERCVYDTKNRPNIASFKYKQEGRFCLVVAKVEGQYGAIIGKRFPVFGYTEKKIVTIDACKNKS